MPGHLAVVALRAIGQQPSPSDRGRAHHELQLLLDADAISPSDYLAAIDNVDNS